MSSKSKNIIEPEFLKELHGFETFLERMGFKRTEGAVYGLLILARHPLTSEEIEKTLHLSQGAVSMALKKLLHFRALEVREARQGRSKRHYLAREDSFAVAATIFRKREQEAIEEFKALAQGLLQKVKTGNALRNKRLKSIIHTCEVAEAVMNLVIGLSSQKEVFQGPEIVKKLPGVLQNLPQEIRPLGQMASSLTSALTTKLKTKWIQATSSSREGT